MSDVVLPINPENIYAELEHVEKVVAKWRDQVGKGVVGVDLPGVNAEEKLEAFLREFTGEMLFVAGKCQNMAMILSER